MNFFTVGIVCFSWKILQKFRQCVLKYLGTSFSLVIIHAFSSPLLRLPTLPFDLVVLF